MALIQALSLGKQRGLKVGGPEVLSRTQARLPVHPVLTVKKWEGRERFALGCSRGALGPSAPVHTEPLGRTCGMRGAQI